MPDLNFQPIPDNIADMLGAKAWQARRGAFVFTIASHPAMLGAFDISICHAAPYLPSGPFKSLEEAKEALNQAATTLEG